jgi:protein TonB
MISTYAQRRNPGRTASGIAVAVTIQALAIYGLVVGLNVEKVEKQKQDVETKIIDEVKPPPPDLPPPPPPPPTQAPPPPFIPLPDIIVNAPPPPPVVQQAVVAPPAAPVVRPPSAAPAVPDSGASAKPIAGPPLQYPKRMLDAGREGSVDVACDVDTDGTTSNCEVLNSAGGSAFSDAAMEYVKHAKYKPAIHNGQPVKEPKHRWTITFKLNG